MNNLRINLFIFWWAYYDLLIVCFALLFGLSVVLHNNFYKPYACERDGVHKWATTGQYPRIGYVTGYCELVK